MLICSFLSISLSLVELILLLVGDSDIYFIGGFGTVAWVDVNEYEAIEPDKIAVDGGEQNLKVSYMDSCYFIIRNSS